MKNKLQLVVLLVMTVIGVIGASKADASVPPNVNGRWAGTAFANPAFDFNGDGVAARQFNLTVYGNPFTGLEGVTDTALISIGTCAPNPASLELKAFGMLTFRGPTGDGLYAEVDPSAPNLCFDPSNPSETLAIVITGGTGAYAGATGTGTLQLQDTVRMIKPTIIPPFPFPLPAPILVDTVGTFSLHIQ